MFFFLTYITMKHKIYTWKQIKSFQAPKYIFKNLTESGEVVGIQMKAVETVVMYGMMRHRVWWLSITSDGELILENGWNEGKRQFG